MDRPRWPARQGWNPSIGSCWWTLSCQPEPWARASRLQGEVLGALAPRCCGVTSCRPADCMRCQQQLQLAACGSRSPASSWDHLPQNPEHWGLGCELGRAAGGRLPSLSAWDQASATSRWRTGIHFPLAGSPGHTREGGGGTCPALTKPQPWSFFLHPGIRCQYFQWVHWRTGDSGQLRSHD